MKLRHYFLIVLTALLFLHLSSGTLANTTQGKTIKISSNVYEKVNEGQKARVFIKFKDGQINESLKKLSQQSKSLSPSKNNIRHTFKEGYSADIIYSDLASLEKDDNIESITEVKILHASLTQSRPLINATNTWNLQSGGINLTGEGQTVCIIDTGVNYSHPDLGGCYGDNNASSGCKVIGGINYCVNEDCTVTSNNPMDNSNNGHGTHVAGIVAGNGTIKGVAPNAKIVMIKAGNRSGDFNEDDISAGINWCVNNATQFNISVISMSIGAGLFSDYCDADFVAISPSINAAVAKNISVVISSGNNNNTNQISGPACVQNAIPVSATNKSDSIASFSNRNLLVKLFAPGVNIFSTSINGGSVSMDGTSMSAPHVAGAIAIINQYLKQTSQTKTPKQIELILNNTGKMISDSASALNFSRINVYNAIISLDTQNPNITLLTPSNNTLVTNTTQKFRCNALDLSLKNVTFYLWNSTSGIFNKTSNSSSGNNFTYEINVTNISEGEYSWNCLFTDENNNSAFAASNYSFSIVQLLSSLISPINNLSTNQNQTFQCSANSSSQLTNVTFYLWNSTSQEYNYTRTITGLSNSSSLQYNFTRNGNYSWNCLFTNAVNLTGQAASNYSLIYDTISPQIIPIFPVANSSWNSGKFRININESSQCIYSLNYGKSNTTMNSSDNINFTASNSTLIQNQSYNITFYCNDSANNKNFLSLNFTADISQPSIGLISPAEGYSSTGTTTVLFQYNLSDNLNITSCSLIVNNSTQLTDSNITNKSQDYNFSKSFEPGTYNWSINCTDEAENTGFSVSRIFTISSAPSGGSPGGSSGGSSSGGASEGNVYNPKLEELYAGKTFSLESGDKIKFSLSSILNSTQLENHSVLISSIKNESVKLTIASDPFSIILFIGEVRRLNLSSPDYYNLFIKLESIKNNSANILIKIINEPIIAEPSNLGENIAQGQNVSSTKNNKDSKTSAAIKKGFLYWFLIAVLSFFILFCIIIGTKHIRKIRNRNHLIRQILGKNPHHIHYHKSNE